MHKDVYITRSPQSIGRRDGRHPQPCRPRRDDGQSEVVPLNAEARLGQAIADITLTHSRAAI